MKDIFRMSLKNGLLYLAIGVLVACAIPPLILAASHIGLVSAAVATKIAGFGVADVLYSGLAFAGFGVLDPIMRPFFSAIFGKDTAPSSETKVVVVNGPACPKPSLSVPEQAIGGIPSEQKFAKRLDAERMAVQSSPVPGV